jgi:hypothetical protein
MSSEWSWSPLFSILGEMSETPGTASKGRTVENLVDSCWVVADTTLEGLVLRDGARWTEETLWVRGNTHGRSYALRHEGEEYEFARVTNRRDLFTWRSQNGRKPKGSLRRRVA